MLPVARILKSNGTAGGVLIGLAGIDASELDTKEPVFIEFDGLPVPFFVQDIQPRGNGKVIAHLNDVTSLEDAEEIVGRDIYMEGEEEEEIEEDFTGWSLLDKGRLVGEVTGLEEFPGNPCLCVGEILVPLHEDLVISVDRNRREIDLDLPEGLY